MTGVDVNIGADTREFGTAVRSGMVEPIGDAQQALDDYVDAAQRGGRDLSTTFEQQQRQTSELQDDIQQLNRTIQDGSRPAYRSAGNDATEFSHRSSEGFDEIKESARSNAIEVGASFTGGFDQAAGGLQGFLAEFLAGFGPAGVVAGIAAAAGLGLITQQITEGQEAAEKQKEAIKDLAASFIETGQVGRRQLGDVADQIKAMATSDAGDVAITLQDAFEKAATAGADYQQIVQSIATNDPAEIAKARAALDTLRAGHLANLKAASDYANDPNASLTPRLLAVRDLDEALKRSEQAQKEAAAAAKLAARAGLSDYQRRQDLLKQLGDAYDDAAGSTDDFINKEKKFDVSGYLRKLRSVRSELVKYKEDLAKSDLSPAAQKFLESQGAESAAAMLRGYKAASPNQRAQLNEVWSTSGDQSADSYATALGSNLSKVKVKPPKIERPVVPAPDTSAIDRYLRSPQRLRVMLDVVDRKGQRVY